MTGADPSRQAIEMAGLPADSPTLMLIDGSWQEARNERWIDVENPATKRSIAKVPRGQGDDVERAVRAARAAFPTWAAIPARQRGDALLRVATDIESDAESIARLTALETGNAIRTQARPEVAWAAGVFRYFGGVATEAKGETLPLGGGLFSYSVREPLGVVAAIIPWNSPVILAALKIAMAVSVGNTVVLKAAEDAPLAALKIGAICARHLPNGVINILTGYGEECGAELVRHPLVSRVSFTGSTEIGKEIMAAAASRVVPVSLELGGKSPNIVFGDATHPGVVEGVIAAMRFARQGQSCTAGSRLFVHESIYDSFLSALVASLEKLHVGDPLSETTDMGSLISSKQHSRVCTFIEEGLAQGARAVVGGLPPTTGPLSDGYYAIPTVLDRVENSWRIVREEIFGPVLVAIPWSDVDDVVAMANDTHYGLAAFVWSADVAAAIRVANRLEAGWIQVNRGLGQIVGMSYGGYKQSGFGREFSIEGALDSFTQRKSVTIDLNFVAG